MADYPYSFRVSLPDGKPTIFKKHTQRTLLDMKGQYINQESYTEMLKMNNQLLYEVYELSRPELPGELIHGISILYPGKVGHEYFMTKGHFHVILDTSEIYFCLFGQGLMVMENPEGESRVEELRPGVVLYVPPCWAHRSVNTSNDQNLITLFAYPANAGHDYGTIETKGFRKLIVDQDGYPAIVDNPRWLSREG